MKGSTTTMRFAILRARGMDLTVRANGPATLIGESANLPPQFVRFTQMTNLSTERPWDDLPPAVAEVLRPELPGLAEEMIDVGEQPVTAEKPATGEQPANGEQGSTCPG